MNPDKEKKFKILIAVDIVIVIVLGAILLVLKGGYSETAKRSATEQLNAYEQKSLAVLYEQWQSVDQFNMATKLLYSTVASSDKSEASFTARLASIEGDKAARERQLYYFYTASSVPDQIQQHFLEQGLFSGSILAKDEGGVKTVTCGKNCEIKFTYAGGKLKGVDYKALSEYKPADNFKLDAPAPYRFE